MYDVHTVKNHIRIWLCIFMKYQLVSCCRVEHVNVYPLQQCRWRRSVWSRNVIHFITHYTEMHQVLYLENVENSVKITQPYI